MMKSKRSGPFVLLESNLRRQKWHTREYFSFTYFPSFDLQPTFLPELNS